MGSKNKRQGDPGGQHLMSDVVGIILSGDGSGGNSIGPFKLAGTGSDRCRTARSAANPDNNAVAYGFDFLPEGGSIVREDSARFALADGGDGGHIAFEPVLHLLHEQVAAAEPCIHQVDSFVFQGVETFGAGRGGLSLSEHVSFLDFGSHYL